MMMNAIPTEAAKYEQSNTTAVPSVLLESAPPPWHSVSILGLLTASFVHLLPSLESIDEAATIETFTRRIFPISLRALGFIRLAIALVIWSTSFYTTFLSSGFLVCTAYDPASKLKNVGFRLTGWKSLGPYTHWCWVVLGLSFSLSAAICLDVSFGLEHHISPWMLRAALITWEISAPMAFLVSAVVRHALLPQVIKGHGDLSEFFHPILLMMHNGNIIFCLCEVCLLGGLPVRSSDFSFAPVFGILYVLFSWAMTNRWVGKEQGPQFLYHFMDSTHGVGSTVALVVLTVVNMLSYYSFAKMHHLLDMLGGGILVHASAVVVFASAVCKFVK
jgi:hypothetical protein